MKYPCLTALEHLWKFSIMDLLLNRRRAILSTKGDEYIIFQDPQVEAICMSKWGDGVGVKVSRVAAVGNIGITFRQNTSITSFNELRYFTGLTYIYGASNSIIYGAFYGCTSLKEVTLPNTIAEIRGGAFANSGIETINLDSVTTINKLAFVSSGIKEVNIPNLTTIESDIFSKCASLTKVTSLGRITSILNAQSEYYGMFRECTSLQEVFLPQTLTNIGTYAFYGCSSLNKLVCRSTTPPTLSSNSLTNTPASLKIYVPYSADNSILNAYKSANNWSAHASQIYELDVNGNIPS